MKQITLETRKPQGMLCAGKLLTVWAVYGWSVALIWRALPRSPWTDAAVWLSALLVGLALAIAMGEV
jgi:hypothetical protein